LTNRINVPPYTYDANGNMTNDGANMLVYDADNRTVSSTKAGITSTYSYDCESLRAVKSSGGTTTVYIFSGSKIIAEYQNGAPPAAPTREYIYSGSGLLAKLESGITNYYHVDHLSTRATTDANGTLIGQQGLYPYGDPWYDLGTTTQRKLTDYERDAESGNDYARARYYVNRLGRFASPDPLGGSGSDPQTLNRYSYVANDPVNSTDPSGLFVLAIDRFMDPAGFGSNGFFGANWNEFFFLENPVQVGTATLYHSDSANFRFEDFSSADLAKFAADGEISTLGQWGLYQSILIKVTPSSGPHPDRLTSNQKVLDILFCLWKRGGYGNRDTERSTWITEQNNVIGEQQWPWSAQSSKDTWKGPIPADAVAFAHTHPAKGKDPKPSTGGDKTDDVAADKTGLPNYVVTRDAIWKQVPHQKDPEQVAGRDWYKTSEASEKKGNLKCK
jgi:RHS repeat-associated protein